MKKSHVSFILAAALAAALLAGRGSSGSLTETPGPKEAGSQSQAWDTGNQDGSGNGTEGALSGEITFWHSFTQGPKLETIQEAADKLMEESPDVKVNIETFSWNDFYIKWTTGPASGNVPGMSIALPAQVTEMVNADTLTPINDLIDDTGRDKFVEAAISEGIMDGNNYSVPFYRHAHVMWTRKDLPEKNGLEVPKTWDELYDTVKASTKDGVYGLFFSCGANDFQATSFLDFYMRSGRGSLLTDDLKANLTSDLATSGINYQLKVYNDCSPKDSINFDVLDQVILYHQGKTAFNFNSGLQISGAAVNSPDPLQCVDCYLIPKINADDPGEGIMTANTPMVVWEASKHPEICKAFTKAPYDEGTYIEFLCITSMGMLPATKGIADIDICKDGDTIRQSTHTEKVLAAAVDIGIVLGHEHGPNVQTGVMQSNHVIEDMFQDIITNGTDVKTAAKITEDKLNALFETAE